MNKHKAKFILECEGPKELSEFNEKYNKNIEGHCDRSHLFNPDLQCLTHKIDGGPCKYLNIHSYKGGKSSKR